MNSAIPVAAERRVRVDPWLLSVLLFTASALAVMLAVAASRHLVMAFTDTTSHVLIPRRVFDNVEPGLTQLGTSWGPLFHLLQLPLVWIDPVYRSGGSGVVVSIASSLVTSFYLYKLALIVGAGRRGAALAALLLACSPSFLYVGVVPMLPAAIMATTTANVYYLTRWALTGSGAALLAAALALTAATLTHFDTWMLAPIELAVVLVLAHSRWKSRVRTEATVILWLVGAGYGLFVFVVMNVLIFDDPLSFTRVHAGGGDPFGARVHGYRALLAYPEAAWLIAGGPLVVSGLVGVVLFLRAHHRQPRYLVALLLLYPVVFYTFQAATMGSLIQPGANLTDWHALRYAITILPALALFSAAGLRWPLAQLLVIAGVLASAAVMVGSGRVAALEDARGDIPFASNLQSASTHLAGNVGRGKIFIPVHNYLVDRFEFYSGLPSSAFVDANDTLHWHQARMQARKDPGALRRSGVRFMAVFGDRGLPLVKSYVKRTRAELCYTNRFRRGPSLRVYSLARTCPSR